MSEVSGRFGPRFPRLGKAVYRLTRPLYVYRYRRRNLHQADSRRAQELMAGLAARIERGETCYLAGLGVAGHNSGAALVEVSRDAGIRLLANDEEERFTGVKHFDGYPEHALDELDDRLYDLGLAPRDVHAWTTSWDYCNATPFALQVVFEQFPTSWNLLRRASAPKWDFRGNGELARTVPARLAARFGFDTPPPLVMMPHHENHAAFSYAASPFAGDGAPVMIAVLDGWGDRGAMTLYVAEHGRLREVFANNSLADSLGIFYSIISSTQGGWTTLSSEGRYMGAVAWGDQDRLTNPYYKRLRQIFHFAAGGRVFVNRDLANWQNAGELAPYKQTLADIIGPPIARERMWNPDAVLNVDNIEHSEITRDRVDLAAATQLVFEDVVFHVVEHLIRTTGSSRLVMTGGTALNCLANMKLLDRFNRDWYRRNLGKDARLHLWVPPTPGDAGVTIGAAYSFALRAGVRPGEPLQHAFYCGRTPVSGEIREALVSDAEIDFEPLGNVANDEERDAIADFLAFLVSQDEAVGLFQGPAETGPRALGQRSILANPCNPRTLQNINLRVKHREAIRPLAPMVTPEQAARFFELSEGADDDDFNAYRYMVLTTAARPEAYQRIPAVVHRDGTARIQIVRKEHSPFTYAYLKAMGRRLGVEVSVNTSLNVGSPIAQTPEQALAAMKRAKALGALLLISAEGDAFLAWHAVTTPPKDGGRKVRRWLEEHRAALSRHSAASKQVLRIVRY
jgi:carbamoyltransferase